MSEVTVEEATPEQAREMCLREIDLALKADSLDHMRMHLESAVIWSKGANWPHKHTERVEGCFRCDLSAQEADR